MRTPDPDSAEYFSRTFGTHLYQKVTHRIRQESENRLSEMVGEGSQREAHQFRISPDLIKTLPTGMGAVLIAHGEDTPNGAAHVFKIRFPDGRCRVTRIARSWALKLFDNFIKAYLLHKVAPKPLYRSH
jgi:hypothetical protein